MHFDFTHCFTDVFAILMNYFCVFALSLSRSIAIAELEKSKS